MKTKIPVLVLLYLLALGLGAQTPLTIEPALPEGPITTVEFEEFEFDFGLVDQGESVTKVFTFTNTGKEPLIIISAKGSCGCTVPQWPKEPLLPGETASITVHFDTKGKSGPQNKKVTINANTNPQYTFVYMKGEVLVPDGLSVEYRQEDEDAPPAVQPDCFEIVPNPTAELIQLKMDENRIGKPVTVSVFSAVGQLMAQRHIPEAPGSVEFEVSHYPAGMYIAKVQTEGGVVQSQCFIVSR